MTILPIIRLVLVLLANALALSSVLAAGPVALWRFEPGNGELAIVGGVTFVEGPTSQVSSNLPADNRAVAFDGNGAHVRIPDSHHLRFNHGDEMTIEAWVRFNGKAVNPYIIGKGRLSSSQENQNWALRLMKVGGNYRVSFLFRSRANDSGPEAFHRWNSKLGILAGDLWHHVAVSYRFGDPESIKSFVNGRRSGGVWDLGGATERPPVVDGAEVWIGSSQGGHASNSWHGAIDEVAVHREILDDDVLASRVNFSAALPVVDWSSIGDDVIQVDVFEGLPGHAWPRRQVVGPESFAVPAMALLGLPSRYASGSRLRRAATLVRMSARVTLADHPHEFLLRAPSFARLRLDGEVIAELDAYQMLSHAHQSMRPATPPTPYPRARLGTRDQIVRFTPSKDVHELVVEAVVGRGSIRFSLGELLVATREMGESAWQLVTPVNGMRQDFTPLAMEHYRREQGAAFASLSGIRRRKSRAPADSNWNARDYIESLPPLKVPQGYPGNAIDAFLMAKIDLAQPHEKAMNPDEAMARRSLALLEEHCFRCHGKKAKGDLRLDSRTMALSAGESGRLAIVAGQPQESEVMRRIGCDDEDERMPPKGDALSTQDIATLREWIAAGAPFWDTSRRRVKVPQTIDDAAFLRRLYLDTIGVLPKAGEIRAFRSDSSKDRVKRRVNELLGHSRHADHWTGYWQDVLAENPRLVKGMLNNTGPFRWWIHEALLDKVPFDQFVRELVLSKRNPLQGGASGFHVATQNDVPAAAKAHVIATAFLGTEMKCARCHDAPYHKSRQEDLFSLAAMLEGKPLTVPKSSTVPASFFERVADREPLVKVTLNPGEPVQPAWPFAEYTGDEIAGPDNPRERLAWELTRPENQRFAQVIVNRVWKRYFGQGFVEPVDDWEGAEPSHPELLDYLARDFVANGYDLDRLSYHILTSDAYRREARLHPVASAEKRLFEAPLKRRLTAEQMVDSLFAATGVPVYSEELTFDIPATSKASTFQNLGRPTRAWHFVSLASDRDRPSLTLPRAASIVAFMKAFGWRADRSEPITDRETEATVLQPGMLANGVFATWITRLSPYSDLTTLAIEASSPDQLVENLTLRFLSREPREDERVVLVALLSEGFANRLRKPAGDYEKATFVPAVREVTWSNHLSPEANIVAAETERQVAMGPPGTDFLQEDWRARMEDAVWAIINSPEMPFVP